MSPQPRPGVTIPSPFQAWGTLFLLFLASIVSVIDRQILSLVVDSVRSDLGISDVQISLLQGIAFGIFYATMGVWLGFVADRVSRRILILTGMLLWSCATIWGGLAASFGQLFASRLLVGLGEAALAPAAISLIADLYPPGRRGRAIGIYVMGQSAAQGISIWVAGLVLGAAARGNFDGWPLLAGLASWRVLFVVCGLAGVLVALGFGLTHEPARLSRRSGNPSVRAQIVGTIGHFWRERRRFACVYLGFAACFLGAYGTAAWQIAMISRKFAVTPAEMSAIFGPMAIAFGLMGPVIGGALVDRGVKRAGTAGILRILRIAPLAAIPSACAVLAPNLTVASLLCASLSGITAITGAATLSYFQSAAPSEMCGAAVSITGLVNTLVGAALGPLLIAIATEHVFADPRMVGYALMGVAVPAYLLAALLYGRAAWAETAANAAPPRAPSVRAMS